MVISNQCKTLSRNRYFGDQEGFGKAAGEGTQITRESRGNNDGESAITC